MKYIDGILAPGTIRPYAEIKGGVLRVVFYKFVLLTDKVSIEDAEFLVNVFQLAGDASGD